MRFAEYHRYSFLDVPSPVRSGLQFSVLIITLLSNVVRYIFLSADLYMEGTWEAKGMFSFYNELLSDMLQLSVYLVFFLYVKAQSKYTLPLHIMRDIWLTFNKFLKRWSDFKRYRRVMSTMDEFFQVATEEDLNGGDGICIICRDELRTNVVKLACGHLFHKTCLQGWLKRQVGILIRLYSLRYVQTTWIQTLLDLFLNLFCDDS